LALFRQQTHRGVFSLAQVLIHSLLLTPQQRLVESIGGRQQTVDLLHQRSFNHVPTTSK